MNNHYVCIGYRDLAEGQPVLAYGVHVLSWDFERMGEPRYAFVPAEEIDGDAAELLAVRNEALHAENAALTEQVAVQAARIAELEAENERLREEIFDPDLIIHDKPKSKRQIKATLKGGEG